MGLVIAACGTSSDDTTTTAAADGGGDTGGGEPVTVELILTRAYYVPTGFVEAMLADHNIELIVDVQSNDDILQQLQTRLDAGQDLPDLLGAEDSFLMPAFAESGLVARPWQPFRPSSRPRILICTTSSGMMYGTRPTESVPRSRPTSTPSTTTLEWLEEAGVSFPFDELRRSARRQCGP